MKFYKLLALFVIPVISFGTLAAEKIGFVDWQKVLVESHAAKVYSEQNRKHYQPKLDELHAMREKIKNEESDLEKNSLTLSKDELKKKHEDLEKQKNRFLMQFQKIRSEKEESDNKKLKDIEPDLKQAIHNIGSKGEFSIILDKAVILYHNSKGLDLTDTILKELDKITDKSEQSSAIVKKETSHNKHSK